MGVLGEVASQHDAVPVLLRLWNRLDGAPHAGVHEYPDQLLLDHENLARNSEPGPECRGNAPELEAKAADLDLVVGAAAEDEPWRQAVCWSLHDVASLVEPPVHRAFDKSVCGELWQVEIALRKLDATKAELAAAPRPHGLEVLQHD